MSTWDKTNNRYVGTISLGYDTTGKRRRRTVIGKTKAQVKDKLDQLENEIKAGVRTPATYTVGQCVRDWLDWLTSTPARSRAVAARPRNGSTRRSASAARRW